MASDINITVVNETDEFQNIIIFQQKDGLNKMYNNLFPIAWRVFPLHGKETGISKKGTAIYPVAQTIGITRKARSSDGLPYGYLDICADADNSDQFKYFIDPNGSQRMQKLPDKNDDASVTCLNDASELVTIAYAKDGRTLVVQEDVANGDKGAFLLTPTIYFMYLNNIKEGYIFKSMQTGGHVQDVDLTGLTTVTATLKYTGGAGKQKGWTIEKH